MSALDTDSFRFDELTGRVIAVAPSRRGSWKAVKQAAPASMLPELAVRCPFCPGHEADTEAAVGQAPADGPWQVRVVRNLYPLVRPDAHLEAAGPTWLHPARGVHEVVVETRDHDRDLPDWTVEHVTTVLAVYRDRVRALRALPGVETVAAFRNRGRRAGSSQPHPHGQLVAAAVESPDHAARAARALEHRRRTGGAILEDLVARERLLGLRMVESTDTHDVLCPPAPHHNHETWIVARDPAGCFSDSSDDSLAALAAVLRRTVRRVGEVSGGVAYNLVWRLPPVRTPADVAYWLLEVLPRRGGGAGFELSTGIDVVTVSPERSAELQRART